MPRAVLSPVLDDADEVGQRLRQRPEGQRLLLLQFLRVTKRHPNFRRHPTAHNKTAHNRPRQNGFASRHSFQIRFSGAFRRLRPLQRGVAKHKKLNDFKRLSVKR